MFPLGTVLVPTMVLPLHVFEPRYRALVQRCLSGDRTFGVVLIERGSEVGGGDQRSEVGTVAEIAEARELPDGRWSVVAVGRTRLRVDQWLEDDPYPRAVVAPWPDPEDGREIEIAVPLALLRRALALRAELGETAAPAASPIADDPLVATHQIAALAPVGTFDRQRALEAPDGQARAALLAELLAEECEVLAQRVAGA
jgi:hypothetical protein